MIAIKEHNDIVQQLMKEITSKQAEIKDILRDKNKPVPQKPQTQPTQQEQQLNKKIAQLNKEHKDKVASLSQQMRGKQMEIKELKERLTTVKNMEARQKDHIAEIIKKTGDRKVGSGADHKITALVEHYEGEVGRKNQFIETLQKKVSELEKQVTEISQGSNQNHPRSIPTPNEDISKGQTVIEHQKQVNRLRGQIQKFKTMFEEKDKEHRDLTRKYAELTNDYYHIVNSYGLQQPKAVNKAPPTLSRLRPVQAQRKTQPIKSESKSSVLQNLLHDMAVSESEAESDTSHLTYSRSQQHTEEMEDLTVNELAIRREEELLELLGVSSPSQVIEEVSRLRGRVAECGLAGTVARSLQVFFYNIGKGKLSRKELVGALEDLEINHNRNLEAMDIMDELCILAGAKRDRIIEQVTTLLEVKEEYYDKLKSIQFAKQLSKGSKLTEFIQFFELDKSDLTLPQQLAQLHEQLKIMHKFIVEARGILDIESTQSSQNVLELVLRYLEKTSSLMAKYEGKMRAKRDSAV